MVITDPDSDDEAVACGDILRPDADRFREAGVALVQLLPVGSSGVQGVATLERARLERELDVTPARARILLSTDAVSLPSEAAAGYEGDVQSGLCESPTDDVRVESESDDEFDVAPFEALPAGSDEPVTVAYYGRAGVPGFGLAAAYTDQDFSVLITDPESDEPVACGDILEPEDDEFTEAGLALVQLLPTGDADVQGYAVMQRAGMQRELDVTPTLHQHGPVRARTATDHVADQDPRRFEHDRAHRSHGRREGGHGPSSRPAARLRPGAHRQGRPRRAVPADRDRGRRQLHRVLLRGLPLRAVPTSPPQAVPPRLRRPHRHRARCGRHPRRRRQHREHARRVEAAGRRPAALPGARPRRRAHRRQRRVGCAGSRAGPPTPTVRRSSCSTRASA